MSNSLSNNGSFRMPLLAGNWKMHKTVKESLSLVEQLKKDCREVKDREILVCPPFPSIVAVKESLQGSNIKLGAQNLFWEISGAFTGEVSGPMLKEAGCDYCIIGHSERRQYFGETDQSVQKQIQEGTKDLKEEEARRLVIAYEPVWAIGTGKTASPDQAQEMHAFIRKNLTALYGKETAEQIRILYGGSIKPDNIDSLMAKPDIDGGLVGGASLKSEDFTRIVKYVAYAKI